MVRQLPIGVDSFTKNITADLKTCGCCAQGQSKTDAVFQSNFYDKNEVAKVNFKLDNSACKLDVKELKYQFRNQISFHIGNYTYVINNPIASHA